MNWLHIGSSPSVLEYLPRARQENRIDKTITCNAGILLEPRPDYYAAVDFPSQRRFVEQARAAQQNGTRLITMRREPQAMRDRDCDWYDEFIVMPDGGPPTRDKWGAFQYTGPMCVEYAIRHGAKCVILVGCDGYTGVNDYFDGWNNDHADPNFRYERMTIHHLKPRLQQLARLFPEVQFLQYGDPVYAVDADNWRVIGTGLGSMACL